MMDATDPDRRWDLRDLYPSDDAWHADYRTLAESVSAIEEYRGRLGESASILASALERAFDFQKSLEALHTYASLRADEDLRKSGPQGMRQMVEALHSRAAETLAWIDPELLSLPQARLLAYIDECERLVPYRRYLERLEKRRTHTLDLEGERLLGMTQLVRGEGANISSLLHNADMRWPTVKLSDGNELLVDASGYQRGRILPERGDRRAVFEAFFGELAAFRNSLAASLHLTVKEHVFEARARRYASTLEAALIANEIDTSVYRMLVREIGASLPVLHRYLRLRQRMLDLDRLEYHDLYAPLTSEPSNGHDWESSRATVLEALAPLGEEYVARLDEALGSRWVDVDPRRGKRSGAYVNDGGFDAHPYMLLNHVDDYHSLSTVAHESGHLMHSLLSQQAQEYPNAHYVIFVAEVASTLNEQLLFRHLYERATSEVEKLSLLGHFLETLRGTVFRQTMFAEFELAIHEAAERGDPLTGDMLDDAYGELLRRYHGHGQDVVHVDGRYAVEWAYVPHFHYNFYVYQYATSYVAATALSARLASGEPGALERYLDFLRSGSAAPPVELLRAAGVDMSAPEPITETISEMNRILDEMETLLDA